MNRFHLVHVERTVSFTVRKYILFNIHGIFSKICHVLSWHTHIYTFNTFQNGEFQVHFLTLIHSKWKQKKSKREKKKVFFYNRSWVNQKYKQVRAECQWPVGCNQSNVHKKIQSLDNIYDNMKTKNKLAKYHI